jgi:hypothetical protein
MKATELLHKRIVFAESKFAELVLWHLPRPLPGSRHPYKYRLAYVVDEVCVLRYDNETGKGDHRHESEREKPCKFISPEKLLDDFHQAITRWKHENPDS